MKKYTKRRSRGGQASANSAIKGSKSALAGSLITEQHNLKDLPRDVGSGGVFINGTLYKGDASYSEAEEVYRMLPGITANSQFFCAQSGVADLLLGLESVVQAQISGAVDRDAELQNWYNVESATKKQKLIFFEQTEAGTKVTQLFIWGPRDISPILDLAYKDKDLNSIVPRNIRADDFKENYPECHIGISRLTLPNDVTDKSIIDISYEVALSNPAQHYKSMFNSGLYMQENAQVRGELGNFLVEVSQDSGFRDTVLSSFDFNIEDMASPEDAERYRQHLSAIIKILKENSWAAAINSGLRFTADDQKKFIRLIEVAKKTPEELAQSRDFAYLYSAGLNDEAREASQGNLQSASLFSRVKSFRRRKDPIQSSAKELPPNMIQTLLNDYLTKSTGGDHAPKSTP